ncbi:exocyst complex component 3-like protein [Megaptera novaeangliae]
MSQWWEYPALPRGPGERAILKAKAICGGGRTRRLAKPGSSCPGPEWPEQERAEQLARGAALKWASGIFYRPEQLARLGQYRSREVQRTCSLEARIKSVVQSYLEGVKTGVQQLAWALEAVQGAREALGQAHALLQGMAEAAQTLEPLREQVVQHKQLQAMSQLLPRLRAAPGPQHLLLYPLHRWEG